jgi:hypothetical protein
MSGKSFHSGSAWQLSKLGFPPTHTVLVEARFEFFSNPLHPLLIRQFIAKAFGCHHWMSVIAVARHARSQISAAV